MAALSSGAAASIRVARRRVLPSISSMSKSIRRQARSTSCALPPCKTAARRFIPAMSKPIQGGSYRHRLGAQRGIRYNDKRDGNASFLDYRMRPRSTLPMIDAVIVEGPDPAHPYGVRGVGEVADRAPCGAIANAIYGRVRAPGVLPMSPPRGVQGAFEAEIVSLSPRNSPQVDAPLCRCGGQCPMVGLCITPASPINLIWASFG